MKVTAITCLFVAKDGAIAVRSIEPPLAERYEEPPVPPGMRHAVKVLGLLATIRIYKKTVGGAMPVYEEE
jgi:hypothetical protein